MSRWIGPIVVAVIAALAAWYATLAATPTVIMDRAWERLAEQAGYNRMAHTPLVTADHQTIVRPSPDLAYSICAFDLSQSPLEVMANPVPDHYWSLTVFDSVTDVAFVESDRDTKGAPIRVVLATADQQVPKGARKIVMPDARGVALIRVLLKSRGEIGAVDAYRKQSFCRPLKG
ncbi:putative membrane protein [Blastomonas natatoria]|uniref:Putative membrane protein n=1 Tax=Blastomonas natatoria TaxID=34015 RepID=A0A2V3VCA0_9SPHN|nr:DUF1254 domain-containing protein [Blastomonas natatoria]PXW79446.1 putative membrane protein [Blastomonas natatoria]